MSKLTFVLDPAFFPNISSYKYQIKDVPKPREPTKPRDIKNVFRCKRSFMRNMVLDIEIQKQMQSLLAYCLRAI
jgi:hypothetical protein